MNPGWEWAAFAAAATTIAAGCLAPARWLPPLPNDKLLHCAAFAVLTAFAARLASGPAQFVLWSIGLFLAGWFIEVLQAFVPGRKFCWRDIAANASGILLTALCTGIIVPVP